MKFYDKTNPLYLETDASGEEVGAGLLQTRNSTIYPRDMAPDNKILRPITFASKSLSSAEKRYGNIEGEALGILHGHPSITTASQERWVELQTRSHW